MRGGTIQSASDRRYEAKSVTLAIVTKERFKPTVETLLQLDLNAFAEVIIVDDSTDDALRDWCADRPIKYCRGPSKNRQAARNSAIGECTSPILTFVDDDVLLPTNFADRVAEAFNNHPDAVAIGGPTLSPAVGSARNYCYKERMSINPWTGVIHDDSYRWIPDGPEQVGLLKGANMCFLRDALDRIGGFDTRYGGPAQREETDAIVRIAEFGEIVYHPTLQCLHKQTGSEFGPDLIKWRFRNHGYFVRKNFGPLPFALGFVSLFVRLCGNPDSLAQMTYRRVVLRQRFSIVACLWAYWQGGTRVYRSTE